MSVDRGWHHGFLDHAVGGSTRYHYVPFYRLSHDDQRRARASYPHKSVGAMYDFVDEHYFYPVKRDGRLASGRGAHRSLAIPHVLINDDEYMSSIGYEKNRGW